MRRGWGVALRCSMRAWREQEEDVGAAIRAFSRNLAGRGRGSSAPSTVESVRQLLMPQTSQCLRGASARAGVWRWEVSEVLSAPAAHFPRESWGSSAHGAAGAVWVLALPVVKELGCGNAPRRGSLSKLSVMCLLITVCPCACRV